MWGILNDHNPTLAEARVRTMLEHEHENGWVQPKTLFHKSMDIVTIINLLEQDFCE